MNRFNNNFLANNNSISLLFISNKKIYTNCLGENMYRAYFPNTIKVSTIHSRYIHKDIKYSYNLQYLHLDKCKNIGNGFLYAVGPSFKSISLPECESIGLMFAYNNLTLKSVILPKCKKVEEYFLYFNSDLMFISLPKCKNIGDHSLYHNKKLTSISLPECEDIGRAFLHYNKKLTSISLPKCGDIDDGVLYYNTLLNKQVLRNIIS